MHMLRRFKRDWPPPWAANIPCSTKTKVLAQLLTGEITTSDIGLESEITDESNLAIEEKKAKGNKSAHVSPPRIKKDEPNETQPTHLFRRGLCFINHIFF